MEEYEVKLNDMHEDDLFADLDVMFKHEYEGFNKSNQMSDVLRSYNF